MLLLELIYKQREVYQECVIIVKRVSEIESSELKRQRETEFVFVCMCARMLEHAEYRRTKFRTYLPLTAQLTFIGSGVPLDEILKLVQLSIEERGRRHFVPKQMRRVWV